MAEIDSLSIQILAEAKKAENSLDLLIGKLSTLNEKLSSIKGGGLSDLSTGVSDFATSMDAIKSIDTRTFARVAGNIQTISGVDSTGLTTSASAFRDMANALTTLGGVSENTENITTVASSIGKLGGKSVSNAIANIPLLADALKNLMTTLSSAPEVNSSVIRLINSLSNLASQGSKVGTASKFMKTGLDSASTSAKKAQKSFKSLASVIGSFYANFYWVVNGVKKLWSAIEDTSDYLEAYNYLDVTKGKIAADWYEKAGYESAEAYVESFSKTLNKSFQKMSGVQIEVDADGNGLLTTTGIKNLGLNINEITQYAAQLASVTNSVGQTGEVSIATADAFSKLGADISSLFNIDYSEAMTNLQSGLIGQSRALYKYGIDITNATLQTYAYENGIDKAVSEMTQAEKMQLRMLAILDQSKVSWGDLANTIESPTNMVRQFKNNISELSNILGQLFIPVLTKVMPIVNGVTVALKNLLVSFAEIFGIRLDLNEYGTGYSDLEEEVDSLSDSYDNATNSAKKFNSQTLGLDELNIISQNDSNNSVSDSAGSTIDLSSAILDATAEYQSVWDAAYAGMENRVQEFAAKTEEMLTPLKKLFSDIAIGDWFAVGEDTSNIVSGIFGFFSNAIAQTDWYTLGNNIGLFLAGINWTEILSSIGRFIWEGINASIDLWKGLFDAAPIATTVVTALGVLSGAFAQGGIFSKVTEMFALWTGRAGTFGKSFMAVFGGVGVVTVALAALAAGLGIVFTKNEEVRESFFNAIDAIKNGLQPAIEFISDTVLPNFKAGWDRIIEILSPFSEFLEGVFTDIWQEMINPALTYIGEVVLPKVTQTFENLWTKVLVPFGTFLGDVLEPIVNLLSAAFGYLWKEIIVPLADTIGGVLASAFDNVMFIVNDRVIPVVNAVITVFQFLWNEVFSPLISYLTKTFGPVFESVFGTIKGLINSLKSFFQGLITFFTGTFMGDWERTWSGVKDIFKGVFNGLISIAEGVVNIIIDGVNFLTSGLRDAISDLGDIIGVNWTIAEISHVSLPRFEVGGFPDKASLFWANENGIPELVGTVGGQTAVASGAEITGIADAVYSTGQTEASLLMTAVNLLQQIANKDTSVKIGSKELTDITIEGINERTRTTGTTPILLWG